MENVPIKIPYWKTSFSNGESKLMLNALASGHISQGPEIEEFETLLAKYLDVPYVITTTSGSNALLMSLLIAGVGPGDEVIVPNRTWIATAHAPILLGAKVKFVDVEKDRPIIDAELIEAHITPKTKAIIPVHICGRSANMPRINEIGQKHGITVIEDASQAFGSKNQFGNLGTQSEMGCYSLSVAKIISTGQGGFIATRSKDIYDRLILMRTHGVGSILYPEWREPGFNFRFPGLLAAIGIVQVGLTNQRIAKANLIYDLYVEGFKNLDFIKIIPVDVSRGEVPVYVEALCQTRNELIKFLETKGVQCRPFPPDLNTAKYFNCFEKFPNSEVFSREGLNFPAGPDQSIEDINIVIGLVKEYGKRLSN